MGPANPLPMLRIFVTHVPLLVYTFWAHTLSVSPTSKDWDLLTELVTRFLRSLLNTRHPQPLTKTQAISIRDPGIQGRIWVSKVTLPKPEKSNLVETFYAAFDLLRDGTNQTTGRPEMVDGAVEAEWNGFRSGVSRIATQPRISEEEKYKMMMAEVKSDVTILLMDPATHRAATVKLARLSGGRCLSIRYRLAPQNPFPAALLDALVAYLSLIYPPPGALHDTVPASNIVFAGDSAGGGLAFGLLQLILALHGPDKPGTMLWYGETVTLPVPAGVATNSAWLDTTHALPSVTANARYDYLPLPLPRVLPPACSIWPVDPPRCNLYANDSCLLHPLVSPLTAQSWAHAPPLFLVTGEEMLSDETFFLASRAAAQGVPVTLEHYKAMPHCFAMIMTWLGSSKRCFKSWAGFCRAAVEDPASVQCTMGTVIATKSFAESPLDVVSATELTLDEILALMREARQRRIDVVAGLNQADAARAMPKL
ncbi:MAG: hypothetical protein M1838_001950 [Thelocarpon superellum]|nr:MAG: hypothetical protein M1838_001950 [Thelocarpon superellum]